MNTVLAAIATFAILVPCALYWISAMRREREQPEPEPQAEQERGEETPTFDAAPATVTVEQTFTKKVTNVALTWVKQSIGAGSDESRRAIDPPRPEPARDPEDDWSPPTDLDELPDLTDWDVEVNVDQPKPALSPPLPPATKSLVIERGPLDRIRDLSGSKPSPAALPPDSPRPPALGQPDKDWLGILPDPRELPELELPDLPAIDIPDGVDIERIANAATAEPTVLAELIEHGEPTALPPAGSLPETAVEVAEPIEIVTPVELEGVDMADAPLVPIGRRSMAHVPTVAGFQGALRTFGFRALLTWLTSFRKANTNDLGSAQHLHRMAVGHAHRARVKLAIATNMLQAVQADRLGPNVVRGCVSTWLQCNREAAHAFQVVAATDALVRASGGVPVALRDAIRALDRDHGGMAREARKMTVEPVRDVDWYRR